MNEPESGVDELLVQDSELQSSGKNKKNFTQFDQNQNPTNKNGARPQLADEDPDKFYRSNNNFHPDDGEVQQTQGSHKSHLIEKHGTYKMQCLKLFEYEDLTKMDGFTMIEYQDALYRGQCLGDDMRHGQGIMEYQSGRIYEGDWKNDKRDGTGYERYRNGNTYLGGFERGKANGHGTYYWKTGEIYEGEWLNGYKNGKGIWKNGRGDQYDGDWKENKANGKGVHVWESGDRYEGDWFEFLKHGYGTDFFANGDEYSGEYRYGKPCGRGTYQWKSGAIYAGDFKDGKKTGKGKWEKKQTDAETGQEQTIEYVGDYLNDMKDGQGAYKWATGNTYKGGYKLDKRHGWGEMHWVDGSSYIGEWDNGTQHGYGKMIMANGEVKEGLFENGAFKKFASKEEVEEIMAVLNPQKGQNANKVSKLTNRNAPPQRNMRLPPSGIRFGVQSTGKKKSLSNAKSVPMLHKLGGKNQSQLVRNNSGSGVGNPNYSPKSNLYEDSVSRGARSSGRSSGGGSSVDSQGRLKKSKKKKKGKKKQSPEGSMIQKPQLPNIGERKQGRGDHLTGGGYQNVVRLGHSSSQPNIVSSGNKIRQQLAAAQARDRSLSGQKHHHELPNLHVVNHHLNDSSQNFLSKEVKLKPVPHVRPWRPAGPIHPYDNNDDSNRKMYDF